VVNATPVEQMMYMDSVTNSSHIAAVYGQRCYIGRLVKEVDDMYDTTRGKFLSGAALTMDSWTTNLTFCMLVSLNQ